MVVDKQLFFELAIEHQYLTQDIIDEWGFLPLEEFASNGHMTDLQYREIICLITCQPMPLAEEMVIENQTDNSQLEATTSNDQQHETEQALDTEEQKENSSPPQKVVRLTKNRLPSLPSKVVSTPKLAVSAPKPVAGKTKGLTTPDEHWQHKKIAEYERKLQEEQNLKEGLKQRSRRDLASMHRTNIIGGGLALLVLSLPVVLNWRQGVVCAIMGAIGGYILNHTKGTGASFIFAGAYIAHLFISMVLGIVDLYWFGGPYMALRLTASFMMVASLGAVWRVSIEATYWKNY